MTDTLHKQLLRLGHENPDLRKHLRPILAEVSKEARKDPNEEAYDLIMNKGDQLLRTLQDHVKTITRSLQKAESQLKNLDRDGVGVRHAPSVLSGQMLGDLVQMYRFLGRVVEQVEDIKKNSR